MHPDWDGATETWNLLCRIDIADSVEVTIDSPGGGGFTGQDVLRRRHPRNQPAPQPDL